MNDLTNLLNVVRAVCFSIPAERFGVIVEPFQYMHASKLSWTVKVVLYKDTSRAEIVAVIGEAESRYDFQHEDYDVSAEDAVVTLIHKFERKLVNSCTEAQVNVTRL